MLSESPRRVDARKLIVEGSFKITSGAIKMVKDYDIEMT